MSNNIKSFKLKDINEIKRLTGSINRSIINQRMTNIDCKIINGDICCLCNIEDVNEDLRLFYRIEDWPDFNN